ncbi:DUF975 family protein [Alloscardovia venturai]|uniref:DUF975 family protein n=1 Tax=Alloscardovia venturai TaxID=1769421 RepID=A0ABW2Y1Z8_9BIFI
MTRAQLKAQAKASLQGKYGKSIGLLLIIEVIGLAFGILATIVSPYTRTSEGLYTTSNGFGPFIRFIGGIVTALLGISFMLYSLHVIDRTDKGVGEELVAPYNNDKAWSTIKNALLVWIFTFLWSLLLAIPGIVKSYSYSMSYYLTEDWGNQGYKLKSTEAINESRRLMKGHKWELFVLDLSFLGWIILTPFTLGFLLLWLVPYMSATRAAFYRNLLAQDAQARQTGTQFAQTAQPMQYAQPQAQTTYAQSAYAQPQQSAYNAKSVQQPATQQAATNSATPVSPYSVSPTTSTQTPEEMGTPGTPVNPENSAGSAPEAE